MTSSTTAAIASLITVEASLIHAIDATTQRVESIATTGLQASLDRLASAADEVRERLASAMLQLTNLTGSLVADLAAITEDITERLAETIVPVQSIAPPVAAPAIITPTEMMKNEPLTVAIAANSPVVVEAIEGRNDEEDLSTIESEELKEGLDELMPALERATVQTPPTIEVLAVEPEGKPAAATTRKRAPRKTTSNKGE